MIIEPKFKVGDKITVIKTSCPNLIEGFVGDVIGVYDLGEDFLPNYQVRLIDPSTGKILEWTVNECNIDFYGSNRNDESNEERGGLSYI